MGGRGANFRIIARLPSYEKAVILRRKIKNYILNPSKDPGKAKYFRSLGYNMNNWARLKSDILGRLRNHNAIDFGVDKYGNVSYQVSMKLGITKKSPTITAWRIDKGTDYPRFITAYVDKEAIKNEKKNKDY